MSKLFIRHQPTIESVIHCIESNSGNGLLHIQSILNHSETNACEQFLANVSYEELMHEGNLARYETVISDGQSIIASELTQFMIQLRQKLYGISSHSIELYAFKYLPGQNIPWYRDMDRHAVTAIIYMGNFEGGEYTYKNYLNEDITIAPTRGDMIFSINETASGMILNPPHKVNDVLSGIRYCLVASLVSKRVFSQGC